jgi:hypothetical protein
VRRRLDAAGQRGISGKVKQLRVSVINAAQKKLQHIKESNKEGPGNVNQLPGNIYQIRAVDSK